MVQEALKKDTASSPQSPSAKSPNYDPLAVAKDALEKHRQTVGGGHMELDIQAMRLSFLVGLLSGEAPKQLAEQLARDLVLGDAELKGRFTVPFCSYRLSDGELHSSDGKAFKELIAAVRPPEMRQELARIETLLSSGRDVKQVFLYSPITADNPNEGFLYRYTKEGDNVFLSAIAIRGGADNDGKIMQLLFPDSKVSLASDGSRVFSAVTRGADNALSSEYILKAVNTVLAPQVGNQDIKRYLADLSSSLLNHKHFVDLYNQRVTALSKQLLTLIVSDPFGGLDKVLRAVDTIVNKSLRRDNFEALLRTTTNIAKGLLHAIARNVEHNINPHHSPSSPAHHSAIAGAAGKPQAIVPSRNRSVIKFPHNKKGEQGTTTRGTRGSSPYVYPTTPFAALLRLTRGRIKTSNSLLPTKKGTATTARVAESGHTASLKISFSPRLFPQKKADLFTSYTSAQTTILNRRIDKSPTKQEALRHTNRASRGGQPAPSRTANLKTVTGIQKARVSSLFLAKLRTASSMPALLDRMPKILKKFLQIVRVKRLDKFSTIKSARPSRVFGLLNQLQRKILQANLWRQFTKVKVFVSGLLKTSMRTVNKAIKLVSHLRKYYLAVKGQLTRLLAAKPLEKAIHFLNSLLAKGFKITAKLKHLTYIIISASLTICSQILKKIVSLYVLIVNLLRRLLRLGTAKKKKELAELNFWTFWWDLLRKMKEKHRKLSFYLRQFFSRKPAADDTTSNKGGRTSRPN